MVDAPPLVSPEFVRYLANPALGVGEHRAIIRSLFNFVGRPRQRESLLKVLKSIRAHCASLAAKNDEAQWSVQLGQLRFR